MDHSYFRDKVSAFLDRGLSDEEMFMMAEHISECPECQKLMAEYERLERLTGQSRDLADSDYWEQSARKIEQRLGFSQPETPVTSIAPKRKRSGFGWKLLGAAASVAVLAFIGLHQSDILGPVEQKSDMAPATGTGKRSTQRVGEPSRTVHEYDYDAVPTADVLSDEKAELADRADESPATARTDDKGLAEPVLEEAEVEGLQTEQMSREEALDNLAMLKPQVMSPKPIIDSEVPPAPADEASDMSGVGETVVDAALAPDTARKVVISVKAEAPQILHDEAVDAGAHMDMSTNSLGDSRQKSAMQAPSLPPRTEEPDEVEADETVSTDSLGLDYWRSRRDSLAATLNADAGAHRTAMAKKDVQQLALDAFEEAKGQGEGTLAKYYEAVFMVARLTDDRQEYHRSIDSLRSYIERFDAPLRDLVQGYLDRLED